MESLTEVFEGLKMSAQMKFYFLIVYAVLLVIFTVIWGIKVYDHATRKRASKLSLKYGNADAKEDRGDIGKIIGIGVVLAVAWIVFMIVL